MIVSNLSKVSLRILLWLLILGLPFTSVQADQPTPVIGEPVFTTGANMSPLQTGCTRQDFAPVNAAYEQRVVELVNDERAKVSLPPLKRNTDLDYAARYQAKDMRDDDYFAHDTHDRSGGNLVWVCAWNQRVEKFFIPPGGENAAAGYDSPTWVMDAWMNSGGHKGNILSPTWSLLGVGYYNNGGTYYAYWVQDFSAPSNIFPVVINREYELTSNPDVSLYIYGQGIFTQMRLKNDNDTWTTWEPFQANRSWRLPWLKGIHRVTVELKKADGSVVTSFDEINLSTGAALGNLPSSIFFIYDRSTGKLSPPPMILSPKNTGSTDVIQWQVQAANTWVTLSVLSGSTPNGQTVVQPDNSKYQSPGSSSSSITFHDTAPLQADGSPMVIPVNLVVVNSLPYKTFLPFVFR